MINISINPIAFTIGSFSVGWYGIMLTLAVVVLVLWTMWQVRRGAKISYDTVLTAALVAIPSGIIFSKLLHVIDMWGYYSRFPSQIFSGSGLTIWGAVLGATLGIWIYSKFSSFKFGYFTDLVAPGIVLAQAVGRVGCTILGDDYGLPTSLPWGVVYTNPNSYANAQIGLVATHPVVVYEIIFLLIVFAVLFKLRGRFKPDGSLFLIYLSLYAMWRLGIDFLRVGAPFLLGLHQAQVISIIVLFIALPMLVLRTRWVKTRLPRRRKV